MVILAHPPGWNTELRAAGAPGSTLTRMQDQKGDGRERQGKAAGRGSWWRGEAGKREKAETVTERREG